MPFYTDDNNLIRKALQGSEKSWVKLVKRHEAMVFNYCLRMSGNRSDAFDLMQDIFLAIYRRLPSWEGRGSFKHWLMRIATNKLIDNHRKGERLRRLVDDENETAVEDYETPGLSPEGLYREQQRNRIVLQAMSALPLEQRLIVELKFFQHLSFAEISQQTGISENTVKSRLYAALAKLKASPEANHALQS